MGIETFSGYQQAAGPLGTAGGLANQTSETQQNAKLVVNYINSHGGIAGRKLIAYYHDTNLDSNQTFDSDEQETCAAFTQDHRVLAVVTPEGFDRDTLMSCLARRQTMLLRSSVNVYDQTYASQYPGLFYLPGDLFGNRWQVFIDSLVSQGFFGKGSRIGIIRATWPEEARTANLMRQWLAARGLKVIDELAIQDETSTAGVSATLSNMSSAVLKFRSEHIDHVIFTQGPVFPLGFMVAAQSQQYYPAYALTSRDNLDFLEANAPSAEMRNAAGITLGGLPGALLSNAATRLCRNTIGPNATLNPYCGKLLLLQAALKRAPALTPSGFVAGLRALAGNFSSPSNIAVNFTAHYQDGAAAYRPFRWSNGCSCLAYSGGVGRIS